MNGNTYDVGLNVDYIHCPWASFCMTLKGYSSRSQSFDSKYLENGDRYEVGPPGRTFLKVATGLRLAPSDLTFDDLEGSKIKVIRFDVKYVKNGNSYVVGPIGFTLNDLQGLKVKVTKGAGDGDRHVGIYASPDKWRNCFIINLLLINVQRFSSFARLHSILHYWQAVRKTSREPK